MKFEGVPPSTLQIAGVSQRRCREPCLYPVEQTLVRLGQAGVSLGLVSGAMEGAARTKLIPANPTGSSSSAPTVRTRLTERS